MFVTMRKRIILATVLSFATFGLQACFYESNPPPQQYGQYQSSRTLCDVHGNNCVVCDTNNNNCGSMARSSWGFFF
jgi:hypothetical protein